MAVITATHLTTSGNNSNGTSFNTDSISPSVNKLVIVFVHSHDNAGGNPSVPTLSGAGMTWTQIATRRGSGDTSHRITMFRALSSSPSSGALTISFGATQNEILWSISEFGNIDTSGTNGANAVVQEADNDSGGATSLTVTLGAFGDINNATHGVIAVGSSHTITQGSGFTELAQTVVTDTIESQWRSDNSTSVGWTWGGTAICFGMAIEIKAGQLGGFFNLL